MLAPALTAALALAAASPKAEVFVGPEHAAALIEAGARVLDARGTFAEAPYLPEAAAVDWMALRDGLARTGRLAETKRLVAAFEAAGVRRDRPVLVYGAADDGWGEEGRIWWTLRYLGHPDVHVLDGGVKAWVKAGRPTADAPVTPPRGDFAAKVVPRRRAEARELRAAPKRKDVVVLDVRTDEEYAGATPYLSARGGHVPGARHLEWRDLLAADGRLKPKAALEAIFEAHGVTRDRRVIAYCTGGVRSGFVVAVLAHLGHPDPANYDGSWWEWASKDDLPIEK